MIKKFDKTSVAILTVIAIFAVFALCLTAINIATALEDQATPEATTPLVEQSTEPAIIPVNNLSNEKSCDVNPKIVNSLGSHEFDFIVKGYGTAEIVVQDITISGGYYLSSFTNLPQVTSDPFIYHATPNPFTNYGVYTVQYWITNQAHTIDDKITTSFEIKEIPSPIINLKINQSDTGQAVIRQNNNFKVEVSGLILDPSFRMYIKARDPENHIKFFDDDVYIPISSTTLTYDFNLMPDVSGSWTVEVAIVEIHNNIETVRQRGFVNFAPIANPEPQPTPGGGGSEGSGSQASNAALTADNPMLALLTINLIAIAGLAAWVLTRKRIVIIRPKH